MRVSVMVPFHFGARDSRQRAWNWCRQHWLSEHPGVQLVVADMTAKESTAEEPWSKGKVLARARTRARGEVLVVADADVMVSREQLMWAVRAVRDAGAPWAIPYTWVVRWDQRTTEKLYTTGRYKHHAPGLERGKYRGVKGGGIVVLRPEVYDLCPVDPRFVGWGGEDIAWGIALRVLFGPPAQHHGDLIHLWHEPQENAGRRRPAHPASLALLERYESAGSHEEILAILREFRPLRVVQPPPLV